MSGGSTTGSVSSESASVPNSALESAALSESGSMDLASASDSSDQSEGGSATSAQTSQNEDVQADAELTPECLPGNCKRSRN
ncbi:unnamed protein product [Phytophthora lilii]|uniref:Unnamed protein product n=1 Tax=Phytophthora lilii TaxID=2077276 RepID=A0A9W6XJX3_9STRA|nr:unnamed protein product [Phytophthora lilii]